jgi:hypothetical protein
MLTIELAVLAGTAATVGVLVFVSRPRGRDEGLDPAVESANWRRVDAEVISVLRAGDRRFLLVRFGVGTSIIRNDVRYPLPGTVPYSGQRVPIRYDPAAPARMVFDLHPSSRTQEDVAGRLDG